VASYSWSPDPIAPAESLAAGATVPVTLTALSAGGNPVPGADVVITFGQAPGSDATVTTPAGCTTLAGKEPQFRCQTSNAGHLTLTFQSSQNAVEGGSDAITVRTCTGTTSPAARPSPTATDTYSYD
jgi:hypothetical protein